MTTTLAPTDLETARLRRDVATAATAHHIPAAAAQSLMGKLIGKCAMTPDMAAATVIDAIDCGWHWHPRFPQP